MFQAEAFEQSVVINIPDQAGFLSGGYDTLRLPKIVEYFQDSYFWRKFFETSGQQVDRQSVADLMQYLPFIQKIKAVEGCRTQCDFCDHIAPPETHPAPFVNIVAIVDELRNLRELGFIWFAYPGSKVVLHSNGETLHYHWQKAGLVKDAHDLIRLFTGDQAPHWQRNGQRNQMLVKTAGTHAPFARKALIKIVQDSELDLRISYSFHQASLLARTKKKLWMQSTEEDFAILRPLLNQYRVEFTIHSLSDDTGLAPEPGESPFHLQPQLQLLREMLIGAGYCQQDLDLIFGNYAGPRRLHLSYLRAIQVPGVQVAEALSTSPTYGQHLKLRQHKKGQNYPLYQVFITANTGEIFVNQARYDRTESGYPYEGLAVLPGRLGIPDQNGPSYFTSLARELAPMEHY